MSDNNAIKPSEGKQCTECRYFVGCECFGGRICDSFEESIVPSDDTEIGMITNINDRS